MKRTGRWLAAVLALVLLLSGCNPTAADQSPTLSLYINIPTTDTDALTMVSETLDSYVFQKLGFHVQLNTPSNYSQTLRDALYKGEQVDVALILQTQQVRTYASDGLLLPLDSLLEEYGHGITETIDASYIQDARIDGVLYAFPTNRDRHTIFGFAYNQDLADQYQLDVSGVETPEDLTAVFSQLRAAAPDLYPTVGISSSILYGVMDELDDCLGVLMLDDTNRVVNLYETENFETIVRLLYEWNQAGDMLDYATENRSYTYYIGSGQVFGCLVKGHVLFAAQESKFGNTNVSFIPLAEASYTASNSSRLGYAIAADSAYPQQDMALLNLMYTDSYVADLLMYGIEGTHYTRTAQDSSVLQYPDSTAPEYYTGMYPWQYCNQYIADRWNVYPDGIWDQVEEANLTAIRSPAVGFSFDSTSVARQWQNCSDAVNEYLPVLLAGIADPDTALPAFQQALRNAGIDEVIAEKQRQLDAYIQKTQ